MQVWQPVSIWEPQTSSPAATHARRLRAPFLIGLGAARSLVGRGASRERLQERRQRVQHARCAQCSDAKGHHPRASVVEALGDARGARGRAGPVAAGGLLVPALAECDDGVLKRGEHAAQDGHHHASHPLRRGDAGLGAPRLGAPRLRGAVGVAVALRRRLEERLRSLPVRPRPRASAHPLAPEQPRRDAIGEHHPEHAEHSHRQVRRRQVEFAPLATGVHAHALAEDEPEREEGQHSSGA